MKKIYYPFLAFLVLLPACGGKSSEENSLSEADAAVEVADNDFATELGNNLVTQDGIDPDTALCFATETVNTFGEDRLREWGFSEDSFSIDFENLPMEKISKDELRELLSKERTGKCFSSEFIQEIFQTDLGFSLSSDTTECLVEIRSSDWLVDGLYADSSFEDSPEFLNNLVDDCPSFVADILVSELGIPQEEALCIGQNTSGDTYALFAQSIITPSDEISEEIEEALIEFLEIATECGIDLLDAADSIDEEAYTYGDDPTLDALWESCLNSSGTSNREACDELYWNSPSGSEYEALGACLEAIWGEWDTTLGECNDPFTYGDSPVLDELWERCVNGDTDVCDELYWSSPIDSDYSILGDCLLSEQREWDFESNECIFGDPLNIGTLLPETGALAFLSEPLVLAVDMAIRDINAAGGVNGVHVTLTKGDSGTDPDIANTTVDRLLTEGVDAIIGAAASGITGSVIGKITSAPVVQCSPSNTATGLGTSGDDGYYFRTAPSDDLQAPALADEILFDGYSNVAIVSRADDYGVGFIEEFEPAIENGGGTIVYSTPYAPEATSFDDVVSDVIASGPDAVVIIAFEEGVQIIQTMVEQGAGPQDIQIYITDGMATGSLGELIDPNNPSIAEGIKGTAPAIAPMSGAAFFPDAFAEFAPGVPTIFSAHSYDCAILIALAAEAAGSNDSADIAAQMVAVSRNGEPCSTFAECKILLAGGVDIDYEGASGWIDFLDVGEPSVASYDIYEYDADGEQQVIDELTFGS